jgi:hypothetical protein
LLIEKINCAVFQRTDTNPSTAKKRWAGSIVTVIIILCVREELAHDRGYAVFSALKEKMYAVRHQNPRADWAFPFGDVRTEAFEKSRFVFIVSEDVRLIDPPRHDAVKGAKNI